MDALISLFSLNGRISRRYFWLRQLLIVIFWIIVFVSIAAVFRDEFSDEARAAARAPSSSVLVWLGIAYLFSFALNLSAVVQRYHDRGKSGLWFLFLVVPIVGPIWQFIELGFLPGQKGDNEYGPGRGEGGGAFDRAYHEAMGGASAFDEAPETAPAAKTRAPKRRAAPVSATGPRRQFGVRGMT